MNHVVAPRPAAQAGFPESSSPSLESFSALLLGLHVSARQCDVGAFQREAMEAIATRLPFDKGWWGRATLDGDAHHVHCCYLHGLPQDVPDLLNVSDPHNVVARQVTHRPERAHWFGPNEWAAQESTAALARHMGIEQALCIAHVESSPGLVSFVSLARSTQAPRFSPEESRLLELLMPHLAASLDLCSAVHMTRLRGGAGRAMLTSDEMGWIHVAEPGARELLCSEWAGWVGPRLPPGLVEVLVTRRSSFTGRHLSVDIVWSGEHALLHLRPRGPRDLLTRQEWAVGQLFSAGRSYKEVAAELGLAPATVRHHLRAIYLKLELNDKASLARALGGPALS